MTFYGAENFYGAEMTFYVQVQKRPSMVNELLSLVSLLSLVNELLSLKR
jgi:hypothetical protein